MIIAKANREFADGLYESTQLCLSSLGFDCIEIRERDEIIWALGLQTSDFFVSDQDCYDRFRQPGQWGKMDSLILVRVDLCSKDRFQISSLVDYWQCPVAYVKAIDPYENTVLWNVLLTAEAERQISKQEMVSMIQRKLFGTVRDVFR